MAEHDPAGRMNPSEEPPPSRWPFPPVEAADEPPPSRWEFPPVEAADEHGIVGVGADLEPGTLLAAYRSGLFPMPLRRPRTIAWWSPDPRGILPIDGLRVSRSLRKSSSRFRVTIDLAFAEVIDACRDPARPHGWIDRNMRAAYLRLHQLGWAHSVEAWTADGVLGGGLYGVAIGGLFAGESMFHRVTDASKVALVSLVTLLADAGAGVLDVQWTTDHLRSLGAIDVPRATYLTLLPDALQRPLPQAFSRQTGRDGRPARGDSA